MKKVVFLFIVLVLVAPCGVFAATVFLEENKGDLEIELPDSITLELVMVEKEVKKVDGVSFPENNLLLLLTVRVKGVADLDLSGFFPVLIRRPFLRKGGYYDENWTLHQGGDVEESSRYRLSRFNKKGDVWESESTFPRICWETERFRLGLGMTGSDLRIVFPDFSPAVNVLGPYFAETDSPYSIQLCRNK